MQNKDYFKLLGQNLERYRPFIEYIRFPKYKNLAEDLKITFDYPICVIIGENGTNKSSILRALYGAPANRSLGEYWFETKLDKIKDKDSPSCFIYGYYNEGAHKVVEVLKTRIKKVGNPDYWEPSRPVVKYGMEPMPDDQENQPYRSATRWNAIEKEVVYLDFRHTALSAYDVYFYCTVFQNRKTIKTKQDFIRRYSSHLMTVIRDKLSGFKLYRIERVKEIKTLNASVVQCISEILGKKYDNIQIVSHKFYTADFKNTIFLSTQNGEKYSEAFAGSGEFAVVSLVDAVSSAKDHSLIVLDEPEVSIHPEAQKAVLKFLAKMSYEKKLQVVLATHSPFFVEQLPNKAIKLLYSNEEGITNVRNSVYPTEAFLRIGGLQGKFKIIVEDRCARGVIFNALKRKQVDKMFNVVEPVPATYGAEGIKSLNLLNDFSEKSESTVYCLDGDKKIELPAPDTVSEENLDEEIKKIIGTKTKYPFNIWSDKEKRDFLLYAKRRLLFLPRNSPEEIIWEVLPDGEKAGINSQFGDDYKEALRRLTKSHYGADDAESIAKYEEYHAASIVTSQSPVAQQLDELVDTFLDICQQGTVANR